MKTRICEKSRKTSETNIFLKLNLDGSGNYNINTGVGFFDHMLELFSKHSGFDVTIEAKGDLHIDQHHLVEDTGIVLGEALNECLGDKRGIKRYGFFILPMDDVLVETVIDLSGRSFLNYSVDIRNEKVGDFDTELVSEFFNSFASNGLFNLHLLHRCGSNTHHIIECLFKSTAKALKEAVIIEGGDIASTKGAI